MTERIDEILKKSSFNQHTDEFLIKLEDMNEITKIVQELEELNRILSSDKSMFIEELVREQQQNQRYKQALELVEDELEYAKTTGNDEVRDMYIKNSIRFINEALEGEE